jgi:hypothetical protein
VLLHDRKFFRLLGRLALQFQLTYLPIRPSAEKLGGNLWLQ